MLDANGNDLTDSSHIGNRNPFRYRGYFYDVETGLYYLQTRYYDPEIGRFLNMDDISYADPEQFHGLNLYAYCGNNPCAVISCIQSSSASQPLLVKAMENFVKINSIYKGSRLGITPSQRVQCNVVFMSHYTQELFHNVWIKSLLGNISITETKQMNDAGSFYSFYDHGNDGYSFGIGVNAGNWFGASIYISNNIGIGNSIQISPYFTIDSSISLTEGLSVGFGITNKNNVTNQITFSVGWGTIAGSAIAIGLAASPLPGGRIAAAVVVLLTAIFA